MKPMLEKPLLRLEPRLSRIKWPIFNGKSRGYSVGHMRTRPPQIGWLNWKLSFKRWWVRVGRYFSKVRTL